MPYFAGLDVSLEETAICVVDEARQIVKETRAASDPDTLSDVLQGIGLRRLPSVPRSISRVGSGGLETLVPISV